MKYSSSYILSSQELQNSLGSKGTFKGYLVQPPKKNGGGQGPITKKPK